MAYFIHSQGLVQQSQVEMLKSVAEMQQSQVEKLNSVAEIQRSQGDNLASLNLRFDSSLLAIGIVLAISTSLGNIGQVYTSLEIVEKYNNKKRKENEVRLREKEKRSKN